MKTSTVKIHGLKQKLYFWGSQRRPQLFLFHGWLDTGASFDRMCQVLARRYFCIAPDMRGFGRSEHTLNHLGYFYPEYVADAHALFERFSPQQKLRIVGHSMGGYMTSLYAGAFPERVSHLVNIEGFAARAGEAGDNPRRLREWILGMQMPRFRYFKSLQDFAARLSQANPRLAKDMAHFLAKHLTKKTARGYIMAADPRHKWLNYEVTQLKNLYPFWQNIQARCLLVCAEHTEMGRWLNNVGDVHRELNKRLQYFPAGSQKILMKNCGHMVHQEKPKELAELVGRFLGSGLE